MMGIPSTFLQISLAMLPQSGEVNPAAQASAEPINLDITEGWLDPWPHNHFSRKGTPFIHLFSLEPAFLDRDFFLDYRWASGSEGKEIEVEAELEWALTRRLGIVVEAPFARLSPDG